MCGLNVIQPMCNSVKTKIKTVSRSAAESSERAARAARIKNPQNPSETIPKIKGWLSGLFKPMIECGLNMSENIKTITSTIGKVKREMKISARQAKKTDPKASTILANIKGLKKSSSKIKSAIMEVGGINDVKAATEAGGAMKGSLEAGKAIVRVASSAGLTIAGSVTPVPGAGLFGWVAGEKLSNLLLGKPFSKQAEQIAKNIKK